MAENGRCGVALELLLAVRVVPDTGGEERTLGPGHGALRGSELGVRGWEGE